MLSDDGVDYASRINPGTGLNQTGGSNVANSRNRSGNHLDLQGIQEDEHDEESQMKSSGRLQGDYKSDDSEESK